MRISICIPTYNRASHLANCLQSIIAANSNSSAQVEVCVSDNCSTDQTANVVLAAQKEIQIKYRKNRSNLGIPGNFLNVVEMAEGEFIWLIGDDDLILPYALGELEKLLSQRPNIDYFYVNSYHLTTEYVFSFPQPFDIANLPGNMTPFSSWPVSGEMDFMDLVDPRISFDFLGGMFLSVFRREKWIQNEEALDATAIADLRTFAHFDNTFPHVKIFAKAFADSKAFFCARPLSVCLTGAREWAPMYSFVRSVRLVEALSEYRKNGLPYIRYLWCKNFALKYFIPDIVSMFINRKHSGYAYIDPLKLLFENCLFPNFYFSFVSYFIRKGRLIWSKQYKFLSK